ncbi:ATP-dependent RNA helicase DeaD [Ruminiclostridium sufflavum DSM 19573]|uniref:ATP-dependent RNA helicase CshA n=1 Tax=Ruminiclostridium sufflavum DSM 19573 TaxID=1121337 RepID=A0A318XPT2_9FIRM|nr:DEAD/DEAH box helicase [Ruminiclostridium sufflavum]PYG90331.1 ATP-dependent RNA helicase DeaD [Ruminiclostridium sufflavum DSM 19573]
MENLSFKDFNLSNEVQKAIIDMGFEEATPIQSQSISYILDGNDLIGQAQTGTGKTCAFGIPAVEMINPEMEAIQVLVLCPTRELAIQSSEEVKNLLKYKEGVRILPVYGGQPIDRQIMALKKRPQIIIGTPGRIMDHLRRKTLKLENLKMIVLDEADEMLNMGFREDIDTILEKVPEARQTILFSATMSREILDITKKYQTSPIHIKIAHKELTVPRIEQYYLEVKETAKLEVLSRLIDTNDIKLALIFCNTKRKVDELKASLQSRGYSAEALHGDMRQEQRDKVMNMFRKGNIDILIATDVAARGIDVDDVEAVFNYDLPNDDEYYVHRIGRTGRAGRAGKAFTFISGREIYKLRDIQRYTKSNIKFIKPPSINDVEEKKMSNILKSLKEKLEDEPISQFVGQIEKFAEDINSEASEPGSSGDGFVTSIDIAAALLKLYIDQTGMQTNKVSEIDDASEFTSEGDMVRFFINIGSENKIQPKHIIESLVASSGVPGKLVGSIDIHDRYSFVEVPKEFAPEVLKSMKNYIIKGKRINIEKSNARKKSLHSFSPNRNGHSSKRKQGFSNNNKHFKKD